VVGLEVYTQKTKYMLLSRHQNAGQNCDIRIGNRCFVNVAQFRYLGTTIKNQKTLFSRKIRRRRTMVMLDTIGYRTSFVLTSWCLRTGCSEYWVREMK
jgi:hypothetical protein